MKRIVHLSLKLIGIALTSILVCLCTLIAVVDGNAAPSWFHHSIGESMRGPRVQLKGASWLWAMRHPLLMLQLPSGVQNPGPVYGGSISPAFINGICMADQQAGANGGAKIQACINLQPASGGIVDARGLTGAQTISSTVNLSFSGELLLGAATYTATQCPAFLENTPGLYWHGLAPGHPQTDPGQVTKIISGVNGCGSLIKQQVTAGVRDTRMTDITLDGNSQQATTGIEIGAPQDNRVYYERLGITGFVNGIITDSVAGSRVLDVFLFNLHMNFTNICLNFGQAALGNILVSHSRLECNNQVFVVGTDDTTAANTSVSIAFVYDDLEILQNSTTCVNLGVIRNVQSFTWDGNYGEVGTGATCSGADAIQIGTSTPSTPQITAIRNLYLTLDGNTTTINGVGFISAVRPLVENVIVVSGAGAGHAVHNVAGNTGGMVINVQGGNSAGLPIDSLTGLVIATGNSTVANDLVNTPQGLDTNAITGMTTSGILDISAAVSGNLRFNRNCSSCLVIGTPGDGTNNTVWQSFSNGLQANQFRPANITTVAGGAPAIVYNTASSSVNANITAATMVTAPATNANCPSGLTANCSVYEINWYMDVSAVGTSCTGTTSVVLNFLYTDPLGAGQQTVSTSTINIATNSNGVAGTLVANGTQIVVAKLSTNVQYSTTSFTTGTGCSPAPKYQVLPIVKQLS